MQLKKVIIILAILTVLSGLFMVYLFDVSKLRKYENDNQIKPMQLDDKTQISNKEKKQQMIEFLEKPSEKTPAEQAEIKKKMMEFLEK